MSPSRRVVLSAGLLAAALGLALAVDPGLVDGPDTGEWAVSVLGGMALLYAGVLLYQRRGREYTVSRGPDPETQQTLPTPGQDVDGALAATASFDPRSDRRRRRLRRRLHGATVAAVELREGCDTRAAVEMVEAGTWTDDPVAASYFASGPVEIPGDVPLQERFRLRLSGPTRRAYAARRVAEEVAALTGPGVRR